MPTNCSAHLSDMAIYFTDVTKPEQQKTTLLRDAQEAAQRGHLVTGRLAPYPLN